MGFYSKKALEHVNVVPSSKLKVLIKQGGINRHDNGVFMSASKRDIQLAKYTLNQRKQKLV